jgi:DNA modification methylase
MAKGLARTFGQDLMRGEHEVGTTTNGGVLMPSHTSGDPGFYAKKRAREAEIGRELTTEEFLAEHYEASDAPTASGTSIFDPVLCEIAYRWFCPQGGTVLDPFAGGSVRGIVASRLGRRYVGIELRPEQVEANRAQVAIAAEPLPQGRVGDARDLGAIAADVSADLIFSCPPYWNLERYSDDPADLSTMDEASFFEAQAAIIAAAVARLKDDRFAVWVVGDVRDGRGFYVNLPGRTVEAFEAAGARFYNEAILVTAVGSLPIRTGRQFTAARKLGRTHQSVLVFVKGDPRRATEACGEVEFGEFASMVVSGSFATISFRAARKRGSCQCCLKARGKSSTPARLRAAHRPRSRPSRRISASARRSSSRREPSSIREHWKRQGSAQRWCRFGPAISRSCKPAPRTMRKPAARGLCPSASIYPKRSRD